MAILVFREFLHGKLISKRSVATVAAIGLLCRTVLATTTAHVFDMNVLLTSARGWFQSGTPQGSFGPTLPFAFFLYWIFYVPYAFLQIGGFQDVMFLGHAAGLVEALFTKLFPISMDLTTFLLLLRFKKEGAFVWATFYFLNPLAIFSSAVWGQYEAAATTFIVWGVYWMSKQRTAIAALAFVVSGMIELLGFFPFALLLLNTTRMKQYRSLPFVAAAAIPAVLYQAEVSGIFRLVVGFAGFNVNNGVLADPGRYTLLGNFPQLSIISQLKPLLLSESVILGLALIDVYRQKLDAEKLLVYVALSSISIFFFSDLVAFWLWCLPVCLLYAIMKEKEDLGAFTLVFGSSIAFLELSYSFGSRYLLVGDFPPLLLGVEGIPNSLKIMSIMATSLGLILLSLLRFGSGRPDRTMLRTSAIVISMYLLLYFWLGVYQI